MNKVQPNVNVELMKAVKRNPTSAAVVAKLTHSRLHRHDQPGTGVDVHSLATMSMETSRRREDSRMAMDIFPDVKLAATTLIGLILSPIDGVTTEFKYEFMADIGLPSLAVQEITTVIKEYLEKDLDLRQLAHDIMETTILKDGAAPILIMPESALDDFINNPGSLSSENASGDVSAQFAFRNGLKAELDKIFLPDGRPRSLGVLRNPSENAPSIYQAMESALSGKDFPYESRMVMAFKNEEDKLSMATESMSANNSFTPVHSEYTHFIDNVNVLRLPLVSKKLREISAQKVENESRLGYTRYNGDDAKHDVYKISDTELRNKVFRDPSSPTSGIFATIRSPEYLNRRTIGKPFWKFLPAESVMVVFEPSDPRKRTHYITIIDPDGNPVRVDAGHDSFNMLSKQFNGFADNSSVVTSTLGQLAQTRMDGMGDSNTTYETMRMMNNIHRQLVDANLAAKLRASFGTGELNIGCNEEIYDAMFAREMSNRQTQLLLVPASMINYFAFNIDERGIGRSLLDDSRNILSVRAMLLVSEVFNAIRNSISRTNVDIAFDKRDPDPMKSAEVIKAALLASRGSMLPWGTFDLGALAMHIQRAGLEITYSGDNQMMPNTRLTYTETQSQHQRPDETFRDDLKALSLAGFNMTPDMLEATGNEEFAVAVKNNRAQLARRVAMMSNQFNSEFKVLVRRFIMYNGDVMDRITKIIRENIKSVITHDVRSKKLSASTASVLTKLKDGIQRSEAKRIVDKYAMEVAKEYISAFECTLPAHIKSSFPDRVKEIEEKITALKTVLDHTASTEALGRLVPDTAIIDAWKNQVTADCARQWFAEAGIDVEVSRYLERPDVPTELNIKGKSLEEYNAALINQIVAMAVSDNKAATAVKNVLENAGVVEGSGEDTASSGSSDDTSSSDGDAAPEGGDDGLGEFNFDDLGDDTGGDTPAEEPAAEPEAPQEEPEATPEPEVKEEPAEPKDDAPKDDKANDDKEKDKKE